jgi:hypothetical protein
MPRLTYAERIVYDYERIVEALRAPHRPADADPTVIALLVIALNIKRSADLLVDADSSE